MPLRRSRRSAGFTLVEMVIASVVFTVVVSATLEATLATQSGFHAALSRSELDVRAHRALDVIVDEFQTAGVSALTPSCAPPLGSATLTYRRPTGIAAGAITWDTASTIRFEYGADDPDNGLDDDGDGLVDDGRVVLVRNAGAPNETRNVLATDVPERMPGETQNGLDDNANGIADERGLLFSLNTRLLTIQVAVAGLDPERRPISSVQSVSIQLRN